VERRKQAEIHRVPYGLVAVYSPWNVPLQLGLIPAISALIAGNTVLLKPSEHTPRFNGFIKKLIKRADLPAGVFEIVEGDGLTGVACISVERVYVSAGIYEPFLKAVLHETHKLTRGRDIGPLFDQQAYEKVNRQVEEAIAQGANCYINEPHNPPYFSPVVLTHVHQGMRVMQEETFGPVLPIMAFDSVEEAVQLVNNCDYGLNASIFSNRIHQAKELAMALNTGNVYINDTVTNISDPALPFSGRKKSGYGVSHGKEGLLAFTQPFSLSVRSTRRSRQLNWFPYSEQGLSFIKVWLRLRHPNRNKGTGDI
jgi:acyl-CoA reductase-like NAD-dependent aldehyde dehydrogenase